MFINPKKITINMAGEQEAIMIGFSAVTFMLFYLSTKVSGSLKILGKKTISVEILQPLFTMLGMYFLLSSLATMQLLAEDATLTAISSNLATAYIVILYVTWFLVFYFLISFIYNLFSAFNPKSGSK
jgi:hypothetical protein